MYSTTHGCQESISKQLASDTLSLHTNGNRTDGLFFPQTFEALSWQMKQTLHTNNVGSKAL